ncbi:MAG: EcsC family protein [Deltaproteobacteria bacterium]|nr:EcsC family protein [Deltaproteobacteria bacterium]
MPSLPAPIHDKLSQLYLDEIGRARARVDELREKYPSADTPEMCRRLIDSKKAWASAGGALSGLFGWITLPADLAFVAVLQLSLIMEVALLHKVNLKSDRAREEVLEVLGYSNGADSLNLASRSAPKILARFATRFFTKRGLVGVTRAVPVISAPISAALNNRDIQRAGEAALRYYGTMRQLPKRKFNEAS